MVSAVNGRLKKSDYRTFRIKGQDGQDDYAAMREVIRRRLAHITGDPEAKEALELAPDLILLDGGVGHVHVVREVMEESGYAIPVFGMVKDEFHKTRTLVDEYDTEIHIARQMDVFRFVYGLQEEVHRYTVDRMMNAKRKTLKTSMLEKIHGIGPAKAKALMTHMGTLTAVKKAEVAELKEVPGISAADAEAVYTYFRTKQPKE
jgi:excinuclease ABC subunit C